MRAAVRWSLALGTAAVLAAAGTVVGVGGSGTPHQTITATPVASQAKFRLSGFGLGDATVHGGYRTRATVTFTRKAPTRLVVKISARGVKAPKRVVVKAGSRKASFWVRTSATPKKTFRSVKVRYGDTVLVRKLTVLPLPGLRSFQLSTPVIAPGGSAVGTVRLSGPAQPGGSVVTLRSASRDVSVPKTVRIPAGAKSVSFRFSAAESARAGAVTLTVSRGKVVRTAVLRVNDAAQPAPSSPSPGPSHSPSVSPSPSTSHSPSVPSSPSASPTPSTSPETPPPVGAKVTGLLLEPGIVHLDASATGTVTLDRPAPEGGTVVTLSLSADANEGEAEFPGTVTVPAGTSTADFTVVNKLAERRVPQAAVRIIASAGGGTAEASVTLMGRLRVMAINLHADNVTAGETLAGDVWVMGDNTRAATIEISFTGSLPNTEPVTVTIPEGRSEAVFPFSWTAPDVETTTQARVTAGYGDYFLDRTITVKAKPPVYADHVESITANPPSGTPFNDLTTYRVTITLTAPATKELPILVEGYWCAMVFSPNPVVIPQGATSQTLTIGTTCAGMTAMHLYVRVNDAYANITYPAA